MKTVQKDTVVQISYALHTSTGSLVDMRDGFSYIHGHDTILPGMENVFDGKSKGDSVRAELEPREAFGEAEEQEPIRVHSKDFGKDFERLREGMRLDLQNSNGEKVAVYVQSKFGNYVHLTRNHPLAGQKIILEASILDVRQALPDEIMNSMVIETNTSENSGSCSCC